MIKPQRLRRGDTVAIVSLSSGMGGEVRFMHRYQLGKSRLETVFGLNVVTMPNALRGIEYLYKHPEARAADLMQAFEDKCIKGIFCMIGGDDTIRLLPHINFDTIRNNPKVFMGYSDTTANHFMMYKAGLTSFYGPSILGEFAENAAMHEYTKHHVDAVLFNPCEELAIAPSPVWTSEFVEWSDKAKSQMPRAMTEDKKGYELLQGTGTVQGRLLGGCVDVLPMLVGTEIWPTRQHWRDSILFLETSEERPAPNSLKYILRGLAAQGILDCANGIIFAKPYNEKFYDEYKQVLLQVVKDECGRSDMPIMYNVNFGHTAPMCVLPYGAALEIDCNTKSLRLIEAAVL